MCKKARLTRQGENLVMDLLCRGTSYRIALPLREPNSASWENNDKSFLNDASPRRPACIQGPRASATSAQWSLWKDKWRTRRLASKMPLGIDFGFVFDHPQSGRYPA